MNDLVRSFRFVYIYACIVWFSVFLPFVSEQRFVYIIVYSEGGSDGIQYEGRLSSTVCK